MKGGHSHWQGLMILVEGEAEDRVDQSAFIKMGLDRPIGQFPSRIFVNMYHHLLLAFEAIGE